MLRTKKSMDSWLEAFNQQLQEGRDKLDSRNKHAS